MSYAYERRRHTIKRLRKIFGNAWRSVYEDFINELRKGERDRASNKAYRVD